MTDTLFDAGTYTAADETRYLGECRKCRRPVAAGPDQDRRSIVCPSCASPVGGWARVEGHHSDGRCNSDCMFARRPYCDCSCGGRNHAKGFMLLG